MIFCQLYLLSIAVIFVGPVSTRASNVLLMPADAGFNSRMRNMFKLGRILLSDGHDVTLLVSDLVVNDPLIKKANESLSEFTVLTYKLPREDQAGTTAENQDWLDIFIAMDALQLFAEWLSGPSHIYLDAFLKDTNMWKNMDSKKFDLMIMDESFFGAQVVYKQYGIPVILYENWGYHWLDQNIQVPTIPSFMPTTFQLYSDEMSLTQRAHNLYISLHLRWIMSGWFQKAKGMCIKYKAEHLCDFTTLPIDSSLIFLNGRPFMEYPWPSMPHVVSIQGFALPKAKQLTGDYKTIVDKVDDNGFVVVSFGSMFRRLSPKYSKLFASTFTRLPQTVIWSYEGETPEGLGSNTIVREWVPVIDLLAHPKARLFLTQCGGSSSFEAVNAAIPVVAIPFAFDQPYNCHKLTHRLGLGKYLPLQHISSPELLYSVMQDVLQI